MLTVRVKARSEKIVKQQTEIKVAGSSSRLNVVAKDKRNGVVVVWLDRCSFNSYDQFCRISITIRKFGGKKTFSSQYHQRSQIPDRSRPKYHVEGT